jgi:hypothetical protein
MRLDFGPKSLLLKAMGRDLLSRSFSMLVDRLRLPLSLRNQLACSARGFDLSPSFFCLSISREHPRKHYVKQL